MSDASPPAELRDDTRGRLLDLIIRKGPISATELAASLQLTPAAVRRHLAVLQDEGRIEERAVPRRSRSRGRPSKEFVLAAKAHDNLGHDYDELMTLALNALERVGGTDAVRALAEERMARFVDAVDLDGAADAEQRVERIADAFDTGGYAASVRQLTVPITITDEHGSRVVRQVRTAQLCQGHCPIQSAAEEHPEFCEAETTAIADMLGVPVQRLATLAHGAHACTTHIPLMEGTR